MIKALIADDERLLRADLKQCLSRLWPELVVCAEADDGIAALEAFERERPQIVFLDIRMPGKTGLEVAGALAGRCHIVFVTAYDHFAVEAFERGAIDYLVKPVVDARMQTMIDRLKARHAGPPPDLGALLRELRTQLEPKREFLRWIRASQGNALRLIPIDDVLFFHADEKYTRVVTTDGESLIRKPIKELVDELDPEKFWQIHRATLVNAGAVAKVVRDEAGHTLVQVNGSREKLEVSRGYAHLFKQM